MAAKGTSIGIQEAAQQSFALGDPRRAPRDLVTLEEAVWRTLLAPCPDSLYAHLAAEQPTAIVHLAGTVAVDLAVLAAPVAGRRRMPETEILGRGVTTRGR